MSVSSKKGRTFQTYYRGDKPLTVDEVLTFPCIAVPQQDIVLQDAIDLGIRSELSQQDGVTLVATYFPYHNQDGKLTGFKRRDWTKDKEEAGHFTVVGVVRVNSKLFGQQDCKPNIKATLYICEGEGDRIATRRALLDSLKGGKWEGKLEPNVVSLNCGAGNAREAVAHNEEFIRSFGKIVCLMDNDSATDMERVKGIKKGKEATEDIAAYLLAQNFYIVEFPDKVKDPREWFKSDPKEFARVLTWDAKKYSPEKIVELDSISVSDLRKKKKRGIPLRNLKLLEKKTGSPIKSELWTCTGPSGAGKSTIARDIEFDIASYLMYGIKDKSQFKENEVKVCEDGFYRLADYDQDEKLGIIRLEEGYEESLNSLYAMDIGVEPKSFVAEPDLFLTEDEHAELHKKWTEKGKLIVLNHFGSLQIDSLISKLKQMMAYGVRWFILDHYTMLVSGMRTGNDVKELDIIMTELAAFCSQYNVFILGVSHMKRKNFEPPKDKSSGESLPFFYPVRKEDLRGSAALEQLSWVVIGIEPEELPNRSRGRVRLVVLKNRRGKVLGNADVLWQNEDGSYSDASEWIVREGCYYYGSDMVHCFLETTSVPEPVFKILDEPKPMVIEETTPTTVETDDEPF